MASSVTIPIRFEWQETCPKDENRWILSETTAPSGIQTPHFVVREVILQEIKIRLYTDQKLKDHLQKYGYEIHFRTKVQVAGYTQGLVDINSKDIRIERLEDLFRDPFRDPSSGKMIAICIHLSLQKWTRNPRSAEDWVKDDGFEGDRGLEYLRIGRSKDRDIDEDDVLTTALEQALVAEIDREKKSVSLALVPYWNFGNLLIGDGEGGQYVNDYDDCIFDDRYIDWKSDAELIKMVLAQKQSSAGVPLLPTMCFNTFVPRAVHLLPRNKIDINVVVRWVNRLGTWESIDLEFDANHQFVSDADDEYANTHEYLTQQLAEQAPALFEAPLKDTWNLECWVLPQDGPQWKMFRYPTGEPSSDNTLQQFLTKSEVDEGIYRLYMEVHLIAKEGARHGAV